MFSYSEKKIRNLNGVFFYCELYAIKLRHNEIEHYWTDLYPVSFMIRYHFLCTKNSVISCDHHKYLRICLYRILAWTRCEHSLKSTVHLKLRFEMIFFINHLFIFIFFVFKHLIYLSWILQTSKSYRCILYAFIAIIICKKYFR